MKHFKSIIAIVLSALMLAAFPADSDAKARKSKSKTTVTTSSRHSKSKKSSSRTTKRSSKSTSSKSSRKKKRTGSTARRSYWSPFASFETTASPSPYYVPSDSIASLTRKAAAGNREAQYLLGCSYFERRVRGANRDSADIQAAQYWRAAAEQAHPTAMGDYAFCLRTGRGVPADTLAAVDLYVASIKKGNNRLEKLIRQNASRGSGFDAYVMARATEAGVTPSPGFNTARYEEIAMTGGFTPAIISQAERELAMSNTNRAVALLRSIKYPDDATISRILEMLQRAGTTDIDLLVNMASTGYPEAQLTLANILLERGDTTEGAKWMYKAAQNGSDAALENIVKLLAYPEGQLYDPYQAYLWVDIYADGETSAIGEMALKLTADESFANYAKGLNIIEHTIDGTQPDYASALTAFSLSTTPGADAMALLCTAAGDKKSKAAKSLKQLARSGLPLAAVAYSYLDEKDAFKSLQKASDAGDVAAQNRLGVVLFNRKKYKDAHALLTRVQENAILTEEAALALTESDNRLSEK